ncbi:MAG TPA: PepSY-associated TM helix domain-containing protein [Gemmatimonadaceae bacterium]|nr:PepSY-associated TM helix domain-containing protein [Gemmatimonadaceae bacterium]
MKALRTAIFWCHLVTGVAIALVVLLMSATGVLLTYQKQLTRWADTRGMDGAPRAGADRMLPVDSLLAHARALVPDAAPTAVTWRRDPSAPVEIAFGRERTLFVDAYTGEVLGDGSAAMRRFFKVTTDLHRWLALSGARRAHGKAITGAANLGFLFLVLSGFWLWWPRNWTRAAFRNVGLPRRGLAGKARDFNWHNAIGIWSLLPLVVIVASGVVISYPWASRLVYRAFGESPPPPAERTPQGEARPAHRAGVPRSHRELDAVRAVAERRMPEWRSATVQLPRPAAKTMVIALDAGSGGQPQRRATLTIDRATGTERKWEPFGAGSPARRARSILRFAHTGEVGGVLGQTVAGLVSLGAVLLVWTGLALAWRRHRGWRARTRLARRQTRTAEPTTADERVA